MENNDILISVEGFTKTYETPNGLLTAVKDCSFAIIEGQTLGLVGESGSGKSTLGKMLLNLVKPSSGKLFYQGKDISCLSSQEFRQLRKELQIIFQDPFSSLNPRLTVEQIVGEALEIHRIAIGQAKKNRIRELLDLVGLKGNILQRFPHEFSGGQRQRIAIARALAVEPKFIVCDEPISALDVSIQAQIINLLKELQEKLGLTYLFIAHDLSMVEYLSQNVAVMYLGAIVEIGNAEKVFKNPAHPYTKALIASAPKPYSIEKKESLPLLGEIPSPINPPQGCPFHPRCPMALSICKTTAPKLSSLAPQHQVACHLV